MTEHSPERPGPDGLGYGKCTGCGEIWPCSSSRPATPAELHAWLVARWTARRAIAHAATPGPWFFDAAPDGRWYIDPGPTQADVGEVRLHTDALHIAANDPAHVIAVCDAALRRLERHAPLAGESGCVVCLSPRVDYVEEWERLPWPCPEVLDDAAPWADRSDFPEELRRV